ncbi:MAG: sugar phosphate isomerase/epimerase [Planctomycetales bacterium]|nr:sugar phosphate isomerase/epimerase [Planctomycetales bacterium]
MKIGMNLLLWSDTLSDELLPVLESLKAMGYDGIEVPIFDLEVDKYAQWAKKLDDLGLERTVVTVRSEADDPMSADEAVRRQGIECNKRALDCCQALGAPLIAGPYHSGLGVFSGAGPTADERKRAVDSMREVAEHAATCGVTLALEYLNRFECYLLNCATDAVSFVREVDHPNCRVMYDTFHANIEEKNIPKAIRTVEPVLAHVHISENDRGTPGTGNVAWDESFDTLREIGYDGWLTIEAFGLALPALAAATRIWRRMYDTEEQLARDGLAFIKSQWEKRG